MSPVHTVCMCTPIKYGMGGQTTCRADEVVKFCWFICLRTYKSNAMLHVAKISILPVRTRSSKPYTKKEYFSRGKAFTLERYIQHT